MKPMDLSDLMVEWCKRHKKYAMLISWACDCCYPQLNTQQYIDALFAAAPYLKYTEDVNDSMGGIMSDERGILTFDTEEEMNLYYRRTVGDDGALDRRCNKYDGPVRVYALTCGPEGLRNENT